MPFGLNVKSVLVGALIGYFLVPMLVALVNKPSGTSA